MSNEKEEKKEYPKQLILERKGERLFHFTKAECQPVKVFPGVNVYDNPEDIELIMDHHAYEGLIESEAHKILNQVKGVKEVKTNIFAAMTVPQCKKIIAKTNNIGALESFRAQEMSGDDRKGVQVAIEDQLKMLKNPSNDDLSN